MRIVEFASPTRFKVSDLEAFDGIPIVDVKPVLDRVKERAASSLSFWRRFVEAIKA